MTWTAILLACSITVPTDCRRHEMLIVTPMPTMAFVEAQARAAEWLRTHPGMEKKLLRVLPGRGV